MDIIYKAFDGKEFNSKDDCLEHEARTITKRFKSDIIGLTESGEKVSLLKGLEQFFEDSYYIFVKTQEASDFINNTDLMVKTPCCKGKERYYYYDEMKNEWRSINERIVELWEEMKALRQIKFKMYDLAKDDN